MSIEGRPFRGELHTTDAAASAGVGIAVPIYESGASAAYTLKSNEYLELHSIQVVTASGGDTSLFTFSTGVLADADNGGNVIARGTYAAAGGIALEDIAPAYAGKMAHTLWVLGVDTTTVDVIVSGTIRTGGDGTSVKPSWRETDQGQL